MLTVHAWSSSVRTLAIVQSSATLSISHFTSIKLQSLLLVFRHGSCTCIQIFRYRQYIEIFSFVIFRLWKFPLFFFFLSCNSLRKPTSVPRPPPPPPSKQSLLKREVLVKFVDGIKWAALDGQTGIVHVQWNISRSSV